MLTIKPNKVHNLKVR